LIGVVAVYTDITERKRAEEEIRQRTAQLEMLREVSLELVAQLDLETLLYSVVSRAIKVVGGDAGGLDIYRPGRDVLDCTIYIGRETAPDDTTFRRGKGLAGRVWETGKPLIVDDYQDWDGRVDAWASGVGHAADMGVPVCWGDEFLGVLEVMAEPPRTFSQADADLLSLFATQAAIAIRNAQILQAEQEQQELAEALEEAAAIVSSTLDIDNVLDRILEQVERAVPGDVFNIMLIEDGVARAVRWRGYKPLGMEEQIVNLAVPVTEYPSLTKMARTGEPVVVLDTATYPDWVMIRKQEWRRSYIGAPIQVAGQTVGFLNVDGTRTDQFGPTDARRLAAFASHAAAAIENAQLHQELREHAGQLEQRVQERTAELEAQYAWLDAILGSTTDGIVVTNEEGSIAHANPVAQAWLTQTLSPEEAARLREAIRSVVTRAEEQPVEILELTGLWN
jgi:GAF domain-containing protein